MSELTKQYFDKQLVKLATKEELKKLATKEEVKNLATKEDIKDVKSLVQTEAGRLETKIETEVAELAGMVSRRFDEVEKKLDVRVEVEQLKFQMKKVWEALNIKN